VLLQGRKRLFLEVAEGAASRNDAPYNGEFGGKVEVGVVDLDGEQQEESDFRSLEMDLAVVGPQGVPAVADMLIVQTLDGRIHGVASDGSKLWTSDDLGGPTIKSFQTSSSEGGAVVPGDDGLLYIFSEENGLALLHMSIPDLVSSCPMTEKLLEGDREIRVVGQRKTSYFELDPNTGHRIRVFTSDTGSVLDGKWHYTPHSKTKDEEWSDIDDLPYPDAPPITIGRVDYHVRAFDTETGLEVWNFTYGELLPRERDIPRFGPQALEMHNGRSTLEKIPITSVFGVSRQRDTSHREGWSFVSELSISHRGQKVIGDIAKAQPIFLQKIHYKNGHEQVFATTSPPGQDFRCSALMFPEDLVKAQIDFEEEESTGGHETCTIDKDFPLQGPYHVTNQMLLPRRDRSTDTSIAGVRALPNPVPGVGEDMDFKPRDDELQNLKVVIGILVAIICALILRSLLDSLKQRNKTDSMDALFDPKTNTEKIGQLTVELDVVLGRGCQGTTVFRGRLGQRPVAVKKVLANQFQLANREIELLVSSDTHPNVVTYYSQEITREFIYLALELCDTTLDKVVAKVREINSARQRGMGRAARKNVRIPANTLKFLKSIASATFHLHERRIVHCDIKPQNVLVIEHTEPSVSEVSSPGTFLTSVGDFYTPKLSDMGLSRRFSGTTSSIHGGSSMHGSGTVGWRAPEFVQSLERIKYNEAERDVAVRCGRGVDVFSLGCVFFYVITGGHHPYGQPVQREMNLLEGNPANLQRIENYPEAHDLIKTMIDWDSLKRPSIEHCLGHPLLWSAEKEVEFLRMVSDRLELDRGEENNNNKSRPIAVPENELQEAFEKHGEDIFGPHGWLQRVHPLLRQDIVNNTRRPYATHSLRDLLRYIRNRAAHFLELEEPLRELLGPFPEGFLNEFVGSNRFPKLIMVCYKFILEHCAHEPEIAAFVGEPIAKEFREKAEKWVRGVTNGTRVTKVLGPPSPQIIEKVRPPPGFENLSPSSRSRSDSGSHLTRSRSNSSGNRKEYTGIQRASWGANGRLNWREPEDDKYGEPQMQIQNQHQQPRRAALRYPDTLCRNWQGSNSCKMGDRCFFAHGPEEFQI